MSSAPIDLNALLPLADVSAHLLRNGGSDDPYVLVRPRRRSDDDDVGDTEIRIADDCRYCTVHSNDDEPMIEVAQAIAGSGKLIADMATALRAMKVRLRAAEAVAEHARKHGIAPSKVYDAAVAGREGT